MIRRWTFLLPLAAIGAACGERASDVVGFDSTEERGFTPADAGASEAGDASMGSVLMCPVTECPFPFATCASSAFLCDVDLMSDDDNCGACGVRCGGPNDNHSNWTCVDGKCSLSCDPKFRDCDGNPTNGCEAAVDSTENCGSCGRKCAEGEVCTNDLMCMTKCEAAGRPDECPVPDKPGQTRCTDLRADDKNCGACAQACDLESGAPPKPGLPQLPSDMYWGCWDSECAAAKCKNKAFGNCNIDFSDGCETELATQDNCSHCGDKCAPDQICFNDPLRGPRCICGSGETRCFDNFWPTCVRIDDDPNNCGGCNHKCPSDDRPHFVVTCTAGACGGRCEEDFADCDGLAENGCEIDTRIDNRNCGGCGHACLPGQVCNGGECLVAPCESEGPTAK